jgi:hypothetical protein
MATLAAATLATGDALLLRLHRKRGGMDELDAFLAGDSPEDVVLYFADSYVDDVGKLAEYGERMGDGIVVVVDGETGRNAFHAATGNDAMAFAKRAMGTEGTIAADLTGGNCPDADRDDDAPPRDADITWKGAEDHETKFVFAFAEEQNEEVGGLYGEGDVVHAYAQCACGTAYSHKWVVGDR